MPVAHPPVGLIPVPLTRLKPYRAAVRRLARLMGPEAPGLVQLLNHELEGCTPAGIVENYLYSVDWFARPKAERETLAMKGARAKPVTRRRLVVPKVRVPLNARLVRKFERGAERIEPSRN